MQGFLFILAGILLGIFLSILEEKSITEINASTVYKRAFYGSAVLCILLVSIGMYLEINAYMQTL